MSAHPQAALRAENANLHEELSEMRKYAREELAAQKKELAAQRKELAERATRKDLADVHPGCRTQGKFWKVRDRTSDPEISI